MKTTLSLVLGLFMSLLFAGNARAQDTVPHQEYFKKLEFLRAYVKKNGWGHNARIYACKVNESGKMCMSGKAMTLEEAINFYNELPDHGSPYCGGCYLVYEEPQLPPPSSKRVRQPEPEPEPEEPALRGQEVVRERERGPGVLERVGRFFGNFVPTVVIEPDRNYVEPQYYPERIVYESPTRYCEPVCYRQPVRRDYCEPRDRRYSGGNSYSGRQDQSVTVNNRVFVTSTNTNENDNAVNVGGGSGSGSGTHRPPQTTAERIRASDNGSGHVFRGGDTTSDPNGYRATGSGSGSYRTPSSRGVAGTMASRGSSGGGHGGGHGHGH